MEARRKAWMEEFAIITGLIGMQFIYAGNSVFVSYLMTLGFKPSTLIILSTVATFVVLAPASFFFERQVFFLLTLIMCTFEYRTKRAAKDPLKVFIFLFGDNFFKFT